MTYAYRLMNMIKLVSAGRKICEESLSTIYFPYRSVVSFGETTRSIGVEGKTQVIIKFSSFVISTSLPVFVHTPTSLKKKGTVQHYRCVVHKIRLCSCELCRLKPFLPLYLMSFR